MFYLVSRLMLICHFSLIFSLSLLCIIFYIRTRDSIVRRLLLILLPLFIHAFASLFYNILSPDMDNTFGQINEAISLFLLVVTSLTVPLILYGVSMYMISLLRLLDSQYRLGKFIISAYSAVFSLFSLYFIVFINGDNWLLGLSRALNEQFITGSLFLFIIAVAALALMLLDRSRPGRNSDLLKGVIISFFPLSLFGVLDLLFFLNSPYKLSFLSYFIFAILIYNDTARHYIHLYEPEKLPGEADREPVLTQLAMSDREKELIPLLLEGKSNRDIGEALFISANTVKTHIKNIYRKAGVSNRLQLLSKLRNHPDG